MAKGTALNTPPAVPTRSGGYGTGNRVQKSAPQPNEPASPNLDEDAITGVSVLKSGVVNGMAYTLYSDGSIEAQLPEGTLRFGSITELRNHIEQSA